MFKKGLLKLVVVLFSLAAFNQSSLTGWASKLHAPITEWSVTLSGESVRSSSPVLADISSAHAGKEIIVAGRDGIVYAYNGSGANLWEYSTGSAIESSPAVGDIDNDGDMEIVVGLGSQHEDGEDGGVVCLDHNGNLVWRFNDLQDRHGATGDGSDGHPDGVYSTPALGDLDGDGDLEIVFGAWDHWLRALNYDGTLLWSVFMRDTIWSSPALGDIDRDGYLEIAIGVDAHQEAAFGTPNGGSLHVLTADGAEVPGFPQHIDEIIQSSPALGDIDGDGWLDIVVGTGNYWGAGHQVHAWDHNGSYLSGWPKSVGDYVFSSPALGDIDNDGLPDVVVGCNDGKIYAWQGDGSQIFAITAQTQGGESNWGVNTSPLLADYDDDGQLEVLYSYHNEVIVIDYDGGWANSSYLATSGTLGNSPAIGNIDSDASIELVAAGQKNWDAEKGELNAWQLDLDDDSAANLPWPMFHRDAARHGHLPAAPVLSAAPSSVDFQHQSGDTTPLTRSFNLSSNGDCDVEWSASAPSGLQVTPSSGAISSTVTAYQAISVQVPNPATYPPGTVNVTISGTSTCGTVDDLYVPVTFESGDFSYIYLPSTMRQHLPVLYSDDFDDYSSGWPLTEDGKTGSGYFGLEYGVHISDNDPDYDRAVARGPFSVSGNYSIQVDARSTNYHLGRCGVIFNASSDLGQYDVFWVDTLWPGDQYEGSHVDRLDPDGTWRYLVRNQVSGTTVENLEPFTLRLEIEGTQISAYVNDVLIHSFTDPYDDPPDGGYVGLYAEHVYYGTGFMEDRHKANCHFDNLIVTAK